MGLGARRVRELFESAKKNAPAIIFIDEIDAMGGKRRVTVGSGSERQTLNQMLASMDGFSKNDGVIVIAATNAAEVLDPALTRPGRFDTKVTVDLPDKNGRRDILALYLSKVVASKDVDVDLVASATPGFSGADLATMVNSAALIAANRGAKEVEPVDFEEARDKIIMGPARKSKVQRAEILRMTAFHEAGHTLVALLTNNTQLLHKVTILPRGPTGGAVRGCLPPLSSPPSPVNCASCLRPSVSDVLSPRRRRVRHQGTDPGPYRRCDGRPCCGGDHTGA